MSFPAPSPNTPRRFALVADDSLLHQRLAVSLLTRRDFQVTVANNGREAAVAARDFAFDLILMDVEMPVLDGCDATRQIRVQESKHGMRVPIVGVTSLEDRDLVLNAGMDGYIAKPLSGVALDDVLRELVAEIAWC